MSLFMGKSEVVGNKLATYFQIIEKNKLYIILRISMRLRLFQKKKKLKQTSEGIIVKIALGSLL